MPSFSALNDIASELQSQMVDALSSAPEIALSVSTDTLVLAPPSDELADDAVGCLYLYHVDIDPHLRNRRLMPDSGDPSLMIKPPLPLQLRFLFVPRAGDEATNQLMLGRVMQHFHDAPSFRPTPGSALAVSRGGAPESIRVRYDLAPYQELAQLWSAFSQPYRLSAGFLVEIITVDSGKAAIDVPRVGEFFAVTDKLTREEDA